MKRTEYRVTFEPSGRRVFALPDTLLLEAAARAGIILNTPCGGMGICGKCRVRLLQGKAEADSRASHALQAEDIQDGWRLACATRIQGPIVVEIPSDTLFEHRQNILADHAEGDMAVDPRIQSTSLHLPEPTRDDDRSDLTRLEDGAGTRLDVPAALWPQLPTRLRDGDWHVNLVSHGTRLLDIRSAQPRQPTHGIAFDLGTTTVVGTLMDLDSGREEAVAATLNQQIASGDDVLSRIRFAIESPENRHVLRLQAQDTLNAVIHELCGPEQRCQNVYSITLAGNTTMQQLFCGIDCAALGTLPFLPAFSRAQVFDAAHVGLHVNPLAEIYLFPQVGGFVGGDTVAGMLAVDFDRIDGPTLLVDIGTNGEIALLHEEVVLCASTAAGPAFEGARIRQGMRAVPGAIEKVQVRDGQLEINVIGNQAPRGLCGTALIDAVAELRRQGLIDETGRMLEPGEMDNTIPRELRDRVVQDDGDWCFRLSAGNHGEHPVLLYQRDVRELQLASGAIRAGINILLQRRGLRPADLNQVLLAGAFGNFIRRNNAQQIGLLPDLPHERIRFIGNAASMGAKMALLSDSARTRAEFICQRCRHVDLGCDPDFQQEFGMAMMFPTADGSLSD